jgi:antitoxin MazE
MAQQAIETSINTWGNGLALRLNKLVAKTAGIVDGTHVRVIAQPGKIIVEMTDRKPTLNEMLASFDTTRHAGEVMAFEPVGKEAR